ncbi:hypothetical protein Tamer19_29750 [Cupriavidus sp. TA19]|nr:hypothetical protein Tamer19_29750 [Cupriavidus sp. TA19]
MRHHHQASTSLANAIDLPGLRHGAGPDEDFRAKGFGQAPDAFERLGRIQWHFDDGEAARDQRAADRYDFIGRDAAQDSDER